MRSPKLEPSVLSFPAAAPEFVPGATVRLRSGGPLLTVATVEGGKCAVAWFAGGTMLCATIDARALMAAEPEGPAT